MWAQLTPDLKRQGRRLLLTVTLISLFFGKAILRAWEAVRPTLVFVLHVLAALILLFEEWGWRPLSNLIARLARFPLWAAAERWIAGLPPYGALMTLAVPSAILIPAKFLGVFLLVTGHFVTALAVIVLAKLASTALIARLFFLTKPQLMQIAWFRRAFEAFVPWQEALFAHIRNSWVWRYGRVLRWRANNYARRTWADLSPRLGAAWVDFQPKALAWTARAQATMRHASDRGAIAGQRLWRRLQAAARDAGDRAAVKGERVLRRLQGPEA
jgi:hypothetical protein